MFIVKLKWQDNYKYITSTYIAMFTLVDDTLKEAMFGNAWVISQKLIHLNISRLLKYIKYFLSHVAAYQ